MDLTELTRKLLDRRPRAEAPLRIVQAGHPALRRPSARALDRLDPDLLVELLEAMTVTMREAPGVGLAAPQIGLPLRAIVVEDRYAAADEDATADDGAPGDDEDPGLADPLERSPYPLRALLDPELDLIGDEWVYAWEGCLSVDGWQSIVPRSRRVRLRAHEVAADGSITAISEELVGWPARILQHETDHLAGTLCHDRMVPRSLIDAGYGAHYEDLADAVRLLRLEGEIRQLGGTEVIVRR